MSVARCIFTMASLDLARLIRNYAPTFEDRDATLADEMTNDLLSRKRAVRFAATNTEYDLQPFGPKRACPPPRQYKHILETLLGDDNEDTSDGDAIKEEHNSDDDLEAVQRLFASLSEFEEPPPAPVVVAPIEEEKSEDVPPPKPAPPPKKQPSTPKKVTPPPPPEIDEFEEFLADEQAVASTEDAHTLDKKALTVSSAVPKNPRGRRPANQTKAAVTQA